MMRVRVGDESQLEMSHKHAASGATFIPQYMRFHTHKILARLHA